MAKDYMTFSVNTIGLLTEIVESGLDRRMGVLKTPINIFRNLLGQVAERAAELNDPKLNVLMLRLWLYEASPEDIPKLIEEQLKLINQK
jgi:hypothetical protein